MQQRAALEPHQVPPKASQLPLVPTLMRSRSSAFTAWLLFMAALAAAMMFSESAISG